MHHMALTILRTSRRSSSARPFSRMSALTLLVAGFLGLSCSTERLTTEGEEPITLSVAPASVSLVVGQSQALQLTVSPSSTPGTPGWTSTNTAVASVSASGLVTALAAGTTRVTASLGSASAGSDITVTAAPPPPPVVTSLVVAPASATLGTSATQQFAATEHLSNGSSRAATGVTWSATGGVVSTTGLYTSGTAAGTYRVIAVGTSGHADTSSITITAAPPPPPTVTALVLAPASATLATGGSQQFTATEQMSDGSSRAATGVTWSATGGAVSASGLYTAGSAAGSYRVIGRGTTNHADTASITINAPPPTVTSLVLTPASATLSTGGTQQFTATEQLSNSTSRAATGVTWSATGGTVSTSGLYTAGSTAGSYRVIARGTTNHADTASITINAPPPTVTSLLLTPSSATLSTGGAQQFTATEQLSNGSSRGATGVTWSATGGTVTSAGLYTAGSTAGSFRVIGVGTSGHADTSGITITAPPGGGGAPTNECASPQAGWIWCDDFEQDRLSSYFEVDNGGGGFGRVSGVGRNGSPGIRIRFTSGQVEGGNLKLAFGRTPNAYFRPVDAGTANYREVYWRMYVRAQTGWQGGAGWKWTRAIVFANANWAEAAIGHVSSFWDNPFYTNGPVRGTDEAGNLRTTRYNDFDNFVYLGQVDGVTPLFATNRAGTWYCVEAHMRLNDAGQSNGILEFWVDGNLEARQASLNFLGSFNAYAINSIFFENYWNGGSPQTQERYWDNIVVSTQRIGC
jgi:hypothetical protein